MLNSRDETRIVLSRAIKIMSALPEILDEPLDQRTATALVMSAALMMKVGAKAAVTRERWLATCSSVFDAARLGDT